MNFAFCIEESLFQIKKHLLRTALSVGGITLGICAVVSMINLSEGAEQHLVSELKKLGSDSLYIKARKEDGYIEKQDMEVITKTHPRITGFKGVYASKENVILNGIAQLQKNVMAFDSAIHEGLPEDYYIKSQDTFNTPLVWLKEGEGVKGDKIKIGGTWFMVSGFLSPDIGNEILGTPDILIRSDDFNYYINTSGVGYTIGVFIVDGTISVQEKLVRSTLSYFGMGVDEYNLVSPETLVKQSTQTQRVFDWVMLCVAAIALVVGGAGIMNTNLSNVSERVSQVGIYRALGARKKDIMLMFLVESVVICLIGAILGLLMGQGLSFIIAHYANWSAVFSMQGVIVATTFSVLTGLVFGVYPALVAAKIEPVEALRKV